MKRRYRLSSVDLANITLMAEEDARRALRRIDRDRHRKSKSGSNGVWSYYKPLLALEDDLFNTNHGMLMRRPQRTLAELEADLEQICGNRANQLENFKRIVRAIHTFVNSRSISGRYEDFGQMNLGPEARFMKYWLDVILNIDGKPFAVFLDLRLKYGLTSKGRQFVFSAMKAHIRDNDPEKYADLEFGILKVPNQSVTLLRPDDRPLLTHAELLAAVDRTYKLLREIEDERRAA